MIYLYFILNVVLTAVIEAAGIAHIYKKSRDMVNYCLMGNLLTNPALTLLLLAAVNLFGDDYYFFILLPLELVAVAAEAFLYVRMGGLAKSRAFLLSFALNSFSVAAGVLLYAVLQP